MLEIANILQNKDFTPQTKITKPWQDRAYQVFKAFNLTRKDLPNIFKFFKDHYGQDLGKIEVAYSFAFDYEGNVPKLKLFLWKFNSLK